MACPQNLSWVHVSKAPLATTIKEMTPLRFRPNLFSTAGCLGAAALSCFFEQRTRITHATSWIRRLRIEHQSIGFQAAVSNRVAQTCAPSTLQGFPDIGGSSLWQ